MGRKPKLKQCFLCPPGHAGWKTGEIVYRRKIPYCKAHKEQIAATKNKGNVCPKCDENEWVFIWGGSVMATQVICGFCGFGTQATELFSDIDIKILGSPIER